MPSGGPRTPANPAPVSGPGKFSKRTDGGPSDKTANLVAAGGSYGSRQALEAQQSAAPVPANQPPNLVPSGGGEVPAPEGPPPDIFGTGVPQGPPAPIGAGPPMDPDVDMTLRAMYARFPSPYIGRLLRGR
jgi:hypothetical protein